MYLFNALCAESRTTEVGDKWVPQVKMQTMKQKQNQNFRQYEREGIILLDSYLETQIKACKVTKNAKISDREHSKYNTNNTETAG